MRSEAPLAHGWNSNFLCNLVLGPLQQQRKAGQTLAVRISSHRWTIKGQLFLVRKKVRILWFPLFFFLHKDFTAICMGHLKNLQAGRARPQRPFGGPWGFGCAALKYKKQNLWMELSVGEYTRMVKEKDAKLFWPTRSKGAKSVAVFR